MPRFRLTSPGYPDQVVLLRDELVRRDWTETLDESWDFHWSFDLHADDVFGSLRPDQRINHVPGIGALHFKEDFARYQQQAARRVDRPGWHDYLPETYSLVREHDEWQAAARGSPDKLWLLKPTNLTGGREMRFVTAEDQLVIESGWIIQRYIDRPLLLPGAPFKHVYRIYVVVTSWDPLVAYLYPDGPVKFTSRPFGTEPHELADLVRHLTNPSVQLTNTDTDDPVKLLDWPSYRRRLDAAGHDADLLWGRIRHGVTQALIAARDPVLRLSGFRCDELGSCYELLGFDITADERLHPWILECNASPSLSIRGAPGSADAARHRQTKQALIADTLTLIGINPAGDPPTAAFAPASDELLRVRAEQARRGRFELLYPGPNASRYAPCFAELSPADQAVLAAFDRTS